MLRHTVIFLFLFAVGFLSGCEKADVKKASQGDAYLLPDLQSAKVTSIELSSAEGETRIAMRDESWWLEAPVDYPAAQKSVGVLLNVLRYAEIGKPLDIGHDDLSQLNLNSETGVTIKLRFDGGTGDQEKEVTLILGELNFPKDTSMGKVTGLGYVGRRYVRVLRDSTDSVYLVPVSLVDLSTKPGFWTDTTFCRVPSFQRLRIFAGLQVTQEISRDRMFGALNANDQNGKSKRVDPSSFIDFETLLKKGQCWRVGMAGSAATVATDRTVVVDDFLGVSYKFRFGEPIEPTEAEVDREALQAGFFNDGAAPILIPFTVEASTTEADTDFFGKTIREKNLSIVAQLKNRVAFLRLQDCESLLQMIGGGQ